LGAYKTVGNSFWTLQVYLNTYTWIFVILEIHFQW
jgi:hypothetical protein